MTLTSRDLQTLDFEHVIPVGMLARYLLYMLARYIYEPYDYYDDYYYDDKYDYYYDHHYDDKYDTKTQHMTTSRCRCISAGPAGDRVRQRSGHPDFSLRRTWSDSGRVFSPCIFHSLSGSRINF
jgi:hypothetical protein